MLAVYAFHSVSISFRLGFVPQPNLHFILPALQAYTSAPHGFGSFLFPFRRLHSFSRYPSPLPTHFQRYIFISASSLPRRINILNISPPPFNCSTTSGNRLLFHVLAVGTFIPVQLRFGNYVRSSLRITTLHYAFIYASSSAPYGISSTILSLHMFRSLSLYLLDKTEHADHPNSVLVNAI